MMELKFLCDRAGDHAEKVGLNGHESLDKDFDNCSDAMRGGYGDVRAIAEFLATIG